MPFHSLTKHYRSLLISLCFSFIYAEKKTEYKDTWNAKLKTHISDDKYNEDALNSDIQLYKDLTQLFNDDLSFLTQPSTEDCTHSFIENDNIPNNNRNCSLQKVCDQSRKNKYTDKIYRNEKGESIPNLNYNETINIFNTCFTMNTAQVRNRIQMQKELKEQEAYDKYQNRKKELADIKYKKQHKATLAAAENFYKSVKNNNESAALMVVAQASVTSVLDSYESKNIDNIKYFKLPNVDNKIPLGLDNKNIMDDFKSLIKISKSDISKNTINAYGKYMSTLSKNQNSIINYENYTSPSDIYSQAKLIKDDPLIHPHTMLRRNNEHEMKRYNDIFENKIKPIFNETKQSLITYLQKLSTKNKSQSNPLAEMIKKISEVEIIQITRGDNLGGMCESPNAGYQPSLNTITLCPQYYLFPRFSIIKILAHELSHPIDPCKQVNLNRLIKNRNISQMTSKIKQSPFSNVLQCLSKKGSITSKKLPQDKINSILEDYRKYGKDERHYDGKIDKTLNDAKELAGIFSTCNFTKLNTTTENEDFSDWLSTEVLVELLNKEKKLKSRRAFEAIYYSTSTRCVEHSDVEKKLSHSVIQLECIQKLTEPTDKEIAMKFYKDALNQSIDEHNLGKKRIQKIMLAHPEISRLLNCDKEKDKGHYCNMDGSTN
ncbi:MAG: hypothetical protein HOO06_12755 [Bdellovibrionaceae bacterium]|nr:hypothetical protein [Pseudobdellovibrionaceae bacterium]